MLENKKILITGGSGSFGTQLIDRLLDKNLTEIRILSRNEVNQQNLISKLEAKYSEKISVIKLYSGDITDLVTVDTAMKGVDYVIHAAANKDLPTCENMPSEAVRVNVIGSENVINSAIQNKVKSVVCLSSDKAAYPINVMGATKLLMEKYAQKKSSEQNDTKICCTRYGNVLCSKGSVVPIWIDQIKNGNQITITEPSMTRYVMTIDEAIDLVLFALEKGENGDIVVKKTPACTIGILAEAVSDIFKSRNEIKVIGLRPGEKLYETMLTDEECVKANDLGDYFTVTLDKNKKTDLSPIKEFGSNSTKLMSVDEVKQKLLEIDYVKKHLE